MKVLKNVNSLLNYKGIYPLALERKLQLCAKSPIGKKAIYPPPPERRLLLFSCRFALIFVEILFL